MAPTGLFCMSGPVAHADDDDDSHSVFSQIPQAALFPPPSLLTKKGSRVIEEWNVKEESGSCHGNVEFLTKLRSPYCVRHSFSDGTCKLVWPSGSFYRGEVVDGNFHGVGTYTSANGTVYEGNWILNKKHGFGRKKYSNGDIYEGFWKCDVPEGQGHYLWSNGSEYRGDWRNGLMCGVGIITWVCGDSYDGEWLSGLADGNGVYTWADGSAYVGSWRKGLKFGAGKFYAPATKLVEIVNMPDLRMGFKGLSITGHESCYDGCVEHPKTLQDVIRLSDMALTDELTVDMETSTDDRELEHSLVLLERHRSVDSNGECGLLFSAKDNPLDLVEERRSSAFCSEHALGLTSWEGSLKQRERPGEVVVRGHRSYDLVMALQLGIRYSVLEVAPGQCGKLLPTHFGPKALVKVTLPKEGFQLKAHLDLVDFKWMDYCPAVFRYLRDLCKVTASDYIQSICGSRGLRELPSPGKSGCLFYVSQDDRFMIKTLRKAEVKTFLRMLPQYSNHIGMYKDSLLTKFYGLHSIKLAANQKVHFVVMGNVFSSQPEIHRVYDLKGSSEGRIANKRGTSGFAPLKDLDLGAVFQLDSYSRHRILEQIRQDCKFLESERIMDYSLLLGLHFREPQQSSSSEAPCVKVDFGSIAGFILQEDDDLRKQNSLQARRSSERWDPEGEIEEGHFALGDERHSTQISSNMYAKTNQRLSNGHCGAMCPEYAEVVLQFGIIDILQEYDFNKRLEHAYKSIYFDPLTISAVDPTSYSARFQHFLHQVLIENR